MCFKNRQWKGWLLLTVNDSMATVMKNKMRPPPPPTEMRSLYDIVIRQ